MTSSIPPLLLLTLGTVCAVASRYSDDPRVLVDGTNDLHSAGWKYISQVNFIRPTMTDKPSLFEVQAYSVRVGSCLMSLLTVILVVSLVE